MIRKFLIVVLTWFLPFMLYVNFIYAFDLFNQLPTLSPLINSSAIAGMDPQTSYFGVSSLIRFFNEGLTGEVAFDFTYSVQGAQSAVGRAAQTMIVWLVERINSILFSSVVPSSWDIIGLLGALVSGIGILFLWIYVIVVSIVLLCWVILWIIGIIAFVVELFLLINMVLCGLYWTSLPNNPYSGLIANNFVVQ